MYDFTKFKDLIYNPINKWIHKQPFELVDLSPNNNDIISLDA